ncbi:uncharacterized protein LOC121726079 [Aricia agestis]|uniref:uncharacterized protein LOC121726079 n=1 Tax=Aricia agestis TaxID=91739 RepID=UPI001C20988F|nr:uncharacterized protein LOC121726079 [Aricia agestis]
MGRATDNQDQEDPNWVATDNGNKGDKGIPDHLQKCRRRSARRNTILREWVDRDSGALTYRLTQVLTGHGCFGQYLCDMARRDQNTACHHCNDDRDTAQHTLLVCPAWSSQRAALQATIGPDITLPAIVRAMLDSQHFWRAVETFAESVMSSKEEAECRREAEAHDPRRRPRRRPGARHGHDVPP